ncbi:MAG: phage tail protein [Chloroflexi bacterium]|nr:phage tail protein [Chloroflexota bacterium]
MSLEVAELHSGHRFVIAIGTELVAAFTECTLPTLEFDVQEQPEGGLNEYVHMLPGRRKSGRVTLKRGLAKSSILLEWYQDLLDGKMENATRQVSIIMFDSMNNIISWWFFDKAMPVKWTGPQLKSDQSAVAVETLELLVHDYEQIKV